MTDLTEIKKEYESKFNHAFGEEPSGFKSYCYECDSSVSKESLWNFISSKLREAFDNGYGEAVGFYAPKVDMGKLEPYVAKGSEQETSKVHKGG